METVPVSKSVVVDTRQDVSPKDHVLDSGTVGLPLYTPVIGVSPLTWHSRVSSGSNPSTSPDYLHVKLRDRIVSDPPSLE